MAVKIIVGHALNRLRELPDESVHAWITSPPYWGLRDYDIEPLVWGGDAACEHVWGDERFISNNPPRDHDGAYAFSDSRGEETYRKGATLGASHGQFCQLCGAWLGSLGLEPTPELYVQHMVEIFRKAKRVLREDGTLWLNLGDSYAGSWGNYAPGGIKNKQRIQTEDGQRWERPAYEDTAFRPPTSFAGNGLKPKDLCGIPWRVALALQADGWWLRSDIIWHKPNPLPESVTDRPTKAHEYVFLLSKSARYFYDAEAIKEDCATDPDSKASMMFGSSNGKNNTSERAHAADLGHKWEFAPKRNKRTVWTIPTQPYKGSHFATFPPTLVEPMIKASTSEKGCCPECGAPWERVIEKAFVPQPDVKNPAKLIRDPAAMDQSSGWGSSQRGTNKVLTTGWSPTCDCPVHDPIPCVVGDMFGGAGTVGLVADRLGRDAILIELNPQYADLARKRLVEDIGPMFLNLAVVEGSEPIPAEQLEMFA